MQEIYSNETRNFSDASNFPLETGRRNARENSNCPKIRGHPFLFHVYFPLNVESFLALLYYRIQSIL